MSTQAAPGLTIIGWASTMGAADRETLSLRFLFSAIPSRECAKHDKNPSRENWRMFVERYQSNVKSTTAGLFSGYSMKCALDCLVLSSLFRFPDCMISVWPNDCGGYVRPSRNCGVP